MTVHSASGTTAQEPLSKQQAPFVSGQSPGSHVVAYTRAEQVVVVVPRLTVKLEERGGWKGTTVELPDGRWRNVFDGSVTDGVVEVARLLERFPVAVLERETS